MKSVFFFVLYKYSLKKVSLLIKKVTYLVKQKSDKHKSTIFIGKFVFRIKKEISTQASSC